MNMIALRSFLLEIIQARFNYEFNNKELRLPAFDPERLEQPQLSRFIIANNLSFAEIVVLFLALIPHVDPGFIISAVSEFLPNGGDLPEFGGIKGKYHRGILPTGETALYLLGGSDIQQRLQVARIFDEDHLFARENILSIDYPGDREPKMSGRLILDDEYIDLFTTGRIMRPKLSADFPAERIVTQLEWKDLVLPEKTLEEIKEIETWLTYNDQLLKKWKMEGKIKPGYRVLFYGPSGTGKTMTACLLGKYTNRDVFRIDLSTVVSKYIGETEKNLSKLFNKAANKNWILFFDEADSIFGKRTSVRDAHDKYANQEVSYLLQRIEYHPGLVILASNMKGNIDASFTRRFNTIIEFNNPGVEERLKLWNNYWPKAQKTYNGISLSDIASKFELTGANIVNVIHYAGLTMLGESASAISKEHLLSGIRKEYKKEGKLIIKG